jgi:Zn-dependent protease
MKFSSAEIIEIAKAWLAISIAFAIVLGKSDIFSSSFLLNFVASSITVGLGFLLHELAHKMLAQKYGCFAEFRAFNFMLVLAIASSFFGFIFAAPGAVFISGHVTTSRNGKISLAGPLTNIVLSLIFLILLFTINTDGLFKYFLATGLKINALLAAFNMIPIMPFDGAKIILWDKKIYWIATISAIALFIASLFI